MSRPPSRRSARNRSAGSGRSLGVRVRTAKGRKVSSTRWLERQLNDPYVQAAQREGYRSRAAYKLLEINEKHALLKPGDVVIDLGAAPGGWTQVAVSQVAAETGKGHVVALDILDMDAVPGAVMLKADFMEDEALDLLSEALGRRQANIVMSDMAASATGHKQTDHLRIMALCEAALDFAENILAPGGVFLAKVLQGGTENTLLQRLKQTFKTVKHVKPGASRADSSELYVLAQGFKKEA